MSDLQSWLILCLLCFLCGLVLFAYFMLAKVFKMKAVWQSPILIRFPIASFKSDLIESWQEQCKRPIATGTIPQAPPVSEFQP
jgi:hypothetical protein